MPTDAEIEAFLAHHGVKGMHWGVRKDRETDEHKQYRKATTKAFKKETQAATVRRIGRVYGKPLSEEQYKNLSDKDVRYKAGKEFVRLTQDAKADSSKNELFVSTNKEDAVRYKSVLTYQDKVIRQLLAPGDKKYEGYQETTYKATKALMGPSEKARVDAFTTLLDTPSVTLRNGKTITGREYLSRTGMAPDIKRLDTQRAGLKYYNTFLQNQWQNTPLNSAYFNSLREKGYNVVADDNDRGVLTKDPLIILDQSGAIKQMNVKQLSTDDILKAQSQYKDLNTS
jgi:hypothetical protein